MNASPNAVLAFWREAGPSNWFRKDEAFDTEIRTRFLTTYQAAAAGQLADWEATAETALALVVVLDQFPRNIFRGSAQAFAADAPARAVADRALAQLSQLNEKSEQYQCRHSESLHYTALAGARATFSGAVMRGGGCDGRSSLSCWTRSFWSAVSSV